MSVIYIRSFYDTKENFQKQLKKFDFFECILDNDFSKFPKI